MKKEKSASFQWQSIVESKLHVRIALDASVTCHSSPVNISHTLFIHWLVLTNYLLDTYYSSPNNKEYKVWGLF